jgi:N-acetylglucosamine kinase-like BadF-type ATPase
MSPTGSGPAVLAVDVGNSKTDLAIVRSDGSVMAAVRGPSGSHQAVGMERAMLNLRELAATAASQAGLAPETPVARLGAFCMAGLDTPHDARRVRAALERTGLVAELLLRNDVFAILRAGAPSGWGVAVVAGAGMNAIGIGPTGRVARFGALGEISGDRIGMGMAALAAAVRGRDGRGPRTSLERAVPASFGLARPVDVTLALYRHRISSARIRELAPVVFEAAGAGDAVAASIVDQLGDEIAAFAVAAIRRTSTARRPVDVVLAGGLVRTADARLLERVGARIHAVARHARIVVLDRPPVVGAALLGLDRLSTDGLAGPAVQATLRAQLTYERLIEVATLVEAATAQ